MKKVPKYRRFTQEQIAKTFSYDGREGRLYRKLPSGKVREVRITGDELHDDAVALRVEFNGCLIPSTHVIWILKTSRWPQDGMTIDHPDNNAWNLKWNNLRLVTSKQRKWNRSSWGISGVKGVYPTTTKRRWEVRIRVDGIAKYFGSYGTIEEAKAVAKRETARVQGEGSPKQ